MSVKNLNSRIKEQEYKNEMNLKNQSYLKEMYDLKTTLNESLQNFSDLNSSKEILERTKQQ